MFMATAILCQSEEQMIEQTLLDYIEGSTNGQPDRLKKAFHPDLNLYYIKNDKVAIWSGQAYIAAVSYTHLTLPTTSRV